MYLNSLENSSFVIPIPNYIAAQRDWEYRREPRASVRIMAMRIGPFGGGFTAISARPLADLVPVYFLASPFWWPRPWCGL